MLYLIISIHDVQGIQFWDAALFSPNSSYGTILSWNVGLFSVEIYCGNCVNPWLFLTDKNLNLFLPGVSESWLPKSFRFLTLDFPDHTNKLQMLKTGMPVVINS